MVYSSKFVMLVMVNGRQLPVRGDNTILIPFGSEYTLWAKNKHRNRRALVQFWIDGENVSGGGYVIGKAGTKDDTIEIKRRAETDAAFKFVELTSAEAALTGKDDNKDGCKGVIEARFFLEKENKRKGKQPDPGRVYPQPQPYPAPTPVPMPWRPSVPPKPFVQPYEPVDPYTSPWQPYEPQRTPMWEHKPNWTTDVTCSVTKNAESTPMSFSVGSIVPLTTPSPLVEMPLPETTVDVAADQIHDGCTVDGNKTGQVFDEVKFKAESDYVSIKVVLRGVNPRSAEEQAKVADPTPDTHCTNCGQKRGRASDRFCGKCGRKF